MMLHAASPTPPDLPLPLRPARAPEDSAAARLAVPTTPPFALPPPLPPAFSGLKAAPDDETTLAEPEGDGWADIGAAAVAPEIAAVDAAPMLQAPAIPIRASDPAVASAGADAAPAPLRAPAAREPRSTIPLVVPTLIDAEPEPGRPTSRTFGVEGAEGFADGKALNALPADQAINPGSAPMALPQTAQSAGASPATQVAPQSIIKASPKLPPLLAEHSALPAALRTHVERAADLPGPMISADAEPVTRAAPADESEASIAAQAVWLPPAAALLPALATVAAPIATFGTMRTDVHAVSGEWPIEPSTASPGLPRAVVEQSSRMVERTGSMPAVAGDEVIRGSTPTLETAERMFTRVAEDAATNPSRTPAPAATTVPTAVVQSPNPQDAVEAAPTTVPPGAVAPQPHMLSPTRADDHVLPSRTAHITAVPLSQTGPTGSEVALPRHTAGEGDAKAPFQPQLAEVAEVAVLSGSAFEAGVSAAPVSATLPLPRLPAENLLQPSATVPLELGSDSPWTERVSLDLGALIDGPVRQLRFKLRPVTLGEMAISVETDRDQLRVAMVVESHEAHAIVTRDLDQLRAAIQQQGLRLDQATVELAASAYPSAAEAQTGGMNGWASQHRQPLPAPGEDGPAAAASSPEAKPQAPPRPVRTTTGGRIDVYA